MRALGIRDIRCLILRESRLRDPTRAGLAGVTYEIAQQAGVTVRLRETDVPVRFATR